jgi:hypothetical protein
MSENFMKMDQIAIDRLKPGLVFLGAGLSRGDSLGTMTPFRGFPNLQSHKGLGGLGLGDGLARKTAESSDSRLGAYHKPMFWDTPSNAAKARGAAGVDGQTF